MGLLEQESRVDAVDVGGEESQHLVQDDGGALIHSLWESKQPLSTLRPGEGEDLEKALLEGDVGGVGVRAVDRVPDPQSHVLWKVGDQIPVLGGVEGDAAEVELGLRPRKPHVRGLGPKVRQLGFCHHEKKITFVGQHKRRAKLSKPTSKLYTSLAQIIFEIEKRHQQTNQPSFHP